jgi:hypothetical protein
LNDISEATEDDLNRVRTALASINSDVVVDDCYDLEDALRSCRE